jgi:uncharacterized protein YdaT
MEHLPPVVRSKAIEIANALLDEGYDEGMAIRIAIAKAKEWAENRGLLSSLQIDATSKSTAITRVLRKHSRSGSLVPGNREPESGNCLYLGRLENHM